MQSENEAVGEPTSHVDTPLVPTPITDTSHLLPVHEEKHLSPMWTWGAIAVALCAGAALVFYVERVKPHEEIVAPQYQPQNLSWVPATSTAEWEQRDSAASFIFQNKIWIMGGLRGDTVTSSGHVVEYWEAPHFNDIWSTSDGVTWTEERANAAWTPRRSMSVVEFNGELWMFGGWSPISGYSQEIWKSSDGVVWTRATTTAPWSAREGQQVEIFQNKIWTLGGVNYDTRQVFNDVWYSSDGLNWQQAPSAPWSPRWDDAITVHDGKLFLTAGMNLNKQTFNDVWSFDGTNWQLITDSPPWQSRQGHGLVSYKGYLWSVGRLNDSEGGGVNDIWFSKDGHEWQKTNTDPLWLGREDHAVLVYNDRIYVFGGMDSNWHWQNDVWMSQ